VHAPDGEKTASSVQSAPSRDMASFALDQLVREGAQRMLAASQAEVDAYPFTCAAELGKRDRRLVVRNAHMPERRVIAARQGGHSSGAAAHRPPRRFVDGERVQFTW
jgi:hypothetical protein